MRATIPAQDLHSTVSTAALVTPRTSDRAGHTAILMSVTSNRLTCTGTDGDTAIASATRARGTDPGEMLLPPRPLASYLATLPPDADVTITQLRSDELQIASPDRSTYTFRPVSATFTLPPGGRIETHPADLTKLHNAARILAHATSKDHGGVQVTSGKKGTSINATDSYRLAHVELPTVNFGTMTVLAPLSILELAARLNLTSVGVDTRRTAIRFASESTSITTKLLAAPFPATEALLASRGNNHITFSVSSLHRALKPLEAVAGPRPLEIEINGDTISITASNLEVGKGTEEIATPEPASGPSFKFSISATYLKDAVNALENVGASTCTLWWTAATAAIYLTSSDPIETTLVVMPQAA